MKTQNSSLFNPVIKLFSKLLIDKATDPTKKLFPCEFCKANINANNLNKHKERCPAIIKNNIKKSTNRRPKKSQSKTIQNNKSSKNTTRSKPILNPDIEIFGSKLQGRIERNLDDSRDYYKFREKGKFGSHSVYDDMGDDANP